jgi:Carboxypeptidase regulatory-like domain
LRNIFGLMAVLLLLSLRGFGQATTAELSGTVQDASGAVVPGAQVIANNIATNIAHSTVSEKNGHYVVGQLPPGDYTITVEAKGFSKLVQTGLSLQVNQQAQLDLTLKVGAQTEIVEVVSQAPLLESESSSVGTVIGQ